MGQSPQEFILVCEWLSYFQASIHAQAWGPFARPWRYTNDSAAEEGIRAVCREKLFERYALIESKLSQDGWAVGEEFTAADLYFLAFFHWSKDKMGVDFEQEFPKWFELVQRLYRFEWVQKSLDEEKKIKEELGPDSRLG